MQVLKVKELGLDAVKKTLDKKAFDEVELNPRIRAKNKELYGEDLTAAQIVDRIVNEVRTDGDSAVIKYTKLLDGAEFSGRYQIHETSGRSGIFGEGFPRDGSGI